MNDWRERLHAAALDRIGRTLEFERDLEEVLAHLERYRESGGESIAVEHSILQGRMNLLLWKECARLHEGIGGLQEEVLELADHVAQLTQKVDGEWP